MITYGYNFQGHDLRLSGGHDLYLGATLIGQVADRTHHYKMLRQRQMERESSDLAARYLWGRDNPSL